MEHTKHYTSDASQPYGWQLEERTAVAIDTIYNSEAGEDVPFHPRPLSVVEIVQKDKNTGKSKKVAISCLI